MTGNNNVTQAGNSQPLSIVTDPLTGQILGQNQNTPSPPTVSLPAATQNFSQVFDLEQQQSKENNGFAGRLLTKGDAEIRQLRLDMAQEIKTHVMKGDRTSLKEAQERYNQCTQELRKRAEMPDTPPLAGTVITTMVQPPPVIPLGVTTPFTIPQPPNDNILGGLLNQHTQQNPNYNTLTDNPYFSGGLITPGQLSDPQRLTTPLSNPGLNQLGQWNAQQLYLLQLQLQQGMTGMPDLNGNNTTGNNKNSLFSF